MNNKLNILSRLIKISNKLDLRGLHGGADVIDGVITKIYDDVKKDSKHKHKSSYMAKPQMAKIHELSSEIFSMIDGEIEDWQESKIAEMAAAIEDVYNSMKYHTNKH